MTAKPPPIPEEQRSFIGGKPDVDGETQGRRDEVTGLQSSQPGDADTNLKSQGRQANLEQNVPHIHRSGDR